MKNPLVVGYKGEIGSYILSGLLHYLPKASNIWCFDVYDSKASMAARIRKADVIFLCVPIDKTVEFFKEWNKQLNGKVIVEQTSLKSILDNLYINEACNCNYIVSMHVLFRPSTTPDVKDHRIGLIVDAGSKVAAIKNLCTNVIDFIRHGLGAELVWFDSRLAHDEAMAIQQALVHRVLLILGAMIAIADEPYTYIGDQVFQLSNRVLSGDPKLYEIIQSNKYLDARLIDQFVKEFKNFDILDYMQSKRS